MAPSDSVDRLTDRKAAILHAIVEGYISTSRPIGSGYVVRQPGLDVSSATIRKDMLALEDDGFLHQPHTSAGRIPTEKAYRYFVDALMGPAELGRVDAQKVSDFFDHAHGEIERTLKETTGLLTKLTDHTAVIVGPQHDAGRLRSIQLVGLSPSLALAVLVRETGAIEKHTVEFADPVDDEMLDRVRDQIARSLIDVSPHRATAPAPTGVTELDSLVDVTWRALHRAGDVDSSVFVGGAAQVPLAFEAAETVRGVLAMLEKQYVMMTLIRDVLDRGLRVAIGTETGVENLEEASLVVAQYTIDGEPVGQVGLLGPTRMNYPQALAAVAVVSRELGNQLSKPRP